MSTKDDESRMKDEEKVTRELYSGWSYSEAESITFLPESGSYRRYYRLKGGKHTVIGAYNEDRNENEAFFSFTQVFHRHRLPVPEVHAIDPSRRFYLLSDLGDVTLFNHLSEMRKDNKDFPEELIRIYKKVIGFLPVFQVVAGKEIDYSKCYPKQAFDSQSMTWDLNYFKY